MSAVSWATCMTAPQASTHPSTATKQTTPTIRRALRMLYLRESRSVTAHSFFGRAASNFAWFIHPVMVLARGRRPEPRGLWRTRIDVGPSLVSLLRFGDGRELGHVHRPHRAVSEEDQPRAADD